MNKSIRGCEEQPLETVVTNPDEIKRAAQELCDKSLVEAKAELHPLLQPVEPARLDGRCEFLRAFKRSMEKRIARQVAIWQPCVQTVFKFDASRGSQTECWDSTIHLLVMVPELLDSIRALGTKLDRDILRRLKRLDWPRFERAKSIIEVQQVTQDEMHRGISYGAMFLSLYAAPVKVWPSPNRQRK